MGFIRQSKIAGYQLGKAKGIRPRSISDQVGYERLKSEEKASQAKSSARRAKLKNVALAFTKGSNKVYGAMTGNIGSKLGKKFKK